MSSSDQSPPNRPVKRRQHQGPKGTRDFYPEDLLRRRYIEKAWRHTSIRHGFEEIEGPTFETAELYKVKSGEGILGEMFGVFSGKAEEEVKQLRETGEAPYALRPEFTPTLARMYAARAAQLPKPTKWFTAGPYFRAERPQRGRLREFCQWNCDIVGGAEQAPDDADVVGCCTGLFTFLGFETATIRVLVNHKKHLEDRFDYWRVPTENREQVFSHLDRLGKIPIEPWKERLLLLGFSTQALNELVQMAHHQSFPLRTTSFNVGLPDEMQKILAGNIALTSFQKAAAPFIEWCNYTPAVVRGLAYYTGLVFEAMAEGERAVCGGGRYDNLIELFGGPPTPAVGFGMGDVVLGNLLQDKGLMPEGPALLEALSAPSASLRPDIFVISNGNEESDAQVRPLVARLRRGQESEAWLAREGRKPWDGGRYAAAPLHARHSYKATKNIGKLLEDARKTSSRYAAIIENAEECTLKNLTTGESTERVKLTDLAARTR